MSRKYRLLVAIAVVAGVFGWRAWQRRAAVVPA